MDPAELLSLLCRRHGVPLAEARCLLPLVERSLALAPRHRRALLDLVRDAVVRKAKELADRERLQAFVDDQSLRAVAEILHDWSLSEPG